MVVIPVVMAVVGRNSSNNSSGVPQQTLSSKHGELVTSSSSNMAHNNLMARDMATAATKSRGSQKGRLTLIVQHKLTNKAYYLEVDL